MSRRDVLVLVAECSGQSVVEFGVGGTTLILARCASSLSSWDTDAGWIEGTRRRLSQMPAGLKSCEPSLALSPGVPDEVPECGVLWVDGLSGQRTEWCVRHFPRCRTLLLHDSRRLGAWTTTGKLLEVHGPWVDSVHMHAGDSNVCVVRRRAKPAEYVNWWTVEKSGRVWPRADADWIPDPETTDG